VPKFVDRDVVRDPVSPPMDIEAWKQKLKAAYIEARPIVCRLGLYLYLSRDLEAVDNVIYMVRTLSLAIA
jgi:hypothetical protein